jgi:8-oxo-dGTP pyrophosphatase MutT (NUDIX family)
MQESKIRVLALALCSDKKKILVFHGKDPETKQPFYRPVGGAIEFGEFAIQAIKREFKEELNATLINVRYLFTLENLFTYNGKIGHEIVLIFDGTLENRSLYGQNLTIVEDDINQTTYPASWESLEEIQYMKRPLYPDGLMEKLRDRGF